MEYQEMIKCDRDIEDIWMLLDELEIVLRDLNEKEEVVFSTTEEYRMNNIIKRVRVIGK